VEDNELTIVPITVPCLQGIYGVLNSFRVCLAGTIKSSRAFLFWNSAGRIIINQASKVPDDKVVVSSNQFWPKIDRFVAGWPGQVLTRRLNQVVLGRNGYWHRNDDDWITRLRYTQALSTG
jgi:hypothetical protein